MVFNLGDEEKPPMYFDGDRPTRFGIMPRSGKTEDGELAPVRWFEQPNCMIYHVANAYEDGDAVVLYAHRHPSTNMLMEDLGQTRARAYLTRWRFDLKTGEATETPIDEEMPSEFPQIDSRLTGRKMRYVFAAVDAVDSSEARFDGIVKYDLETGDRHVFKFEAGCYGGETIFAPNPDSDREGDGWLLTYVHDTNTERSQWQIFAADDLNAGPVARVMMPQRVPYGFHAFWLAGDRG
jgi:carotenoid cleavage dioxygenase